MKRQKLELSLTSPENSAASACIAHKSLRICVRCRAICSLKLQFQEIVKVLFVTICAQRGSAVRLRRHLDVGQFGCISVLLGKVIAEHRAERLPRVAPVAIFTVSKPSSHAEHQA